MSLVGNWLLLVSLPFYVYDLTGSPLATGATFAASAVPALILGSVAGVFADRWDRKRTMVAVDVLRAAVLLSLLAVHSTERLWLVYLITVIQAALGQFFAPSRNALIPRVLPIEHLESANAVDALAVQVTGLVGPALGGGMMAVFGFPSVVVLDSATFLVSAAAVSLVRCSGLVGPDLHAPRTSVPNRDTSSLSCIWHELTDGLRLIRHDRVVRAVTIVMILALLGQGFVNGLLVPFVKDGLHGDARQYAWTVTAQGIGGLVGVALLARLGHVEWPGRLMGAGGVGCGVLILAIVNVALMLVRGGLPWLPAVLVMFALAGVPVMALFVTHLTVLQRTVADAFRGRVFGTISAACTLAMVVGLGIGDALDPVVGSPWLLDLAGALYASAGVAAFYLIPPLRREPSPPVAPA